MLISLNTHRSSPLRFCNYHLKKRKDFLAARGGLLCRTPSFILQARVHSSHQENQGTIRFGLTATRKIGNAVERNRMRRRLWAVIRHAFKDWIVLPPLDLVLIVRPATLTVPFSILESDFHRSLDFLKESLLVSHAPHPDSSVHDGSKTVWKPDTAHLSHVPCPSLPLSVL